MFSRTRAPFALAVAALLLTPGCSLVGSDGDTRATGATGATGSPGGSAPTEVVLLTHGDFSLPEKVLAGFESATGYTLTIRPSDSVGVLVNQVTDEAGNPSGDVVFGVDNTFGSRVLDAGALAPADVDLPAGVADFALPGDDDGALVPVDNGNVCVNYDRAWFAERDLDPPTTLADLTDPAYRDLLAVPSATNSSTGLAFLLATIAASGDDWPAYWRDLLANGARVSADWSEAYYTDFTQGDPGGDYPLVVSYDSSPAFTVDGDESTTAALLDTCFRQVEYAGVLAGAANPEGARALVEYLLGPAVQRALPTSMYVFPVVADTPLPADWARFAPRPAAPLAVDPAEVEANREDWLLAWSDLL